MLVMPEQLPGELPSPSVSFHFAFVSFRLFLIDNPEHPEKLRLYTDGDNAAHTHGRCGSGSFRLGSAEDSRELRNTSLRNFVVKHREPIRTARKHPDKRYPNRQVVS